MTCKDCTFYDPYIGPDFKPLKEGFCVGGATRNFHTWEHSEICDNFKSKYTETKKQILFRKIKQFLQEIGKAASQAIKS